MEQEQLGSPGRTRFELLRPKTRRARTSEGCPGLAGCLSSRGVPRRIRSKFRWGCNSQSSMIPALAGRMSKARGGRRGFYSPPSPAVNRCTDSWFYDILAFKEAIEGSAIMVGTSRDLMSVVDEVKVCYARILESH